MWDGFRLWVYHGLPVYPFDPRLGWRDKHRGNFHFEWQTHNFPVTFSLPQTSTSLMTVVWNVFELDKSPVTCLMRRFSRIHLQLMLALYHSRTHELTWAFPVPISTCLKWSWKDKNPGNQHRIDHSYVFLYLIVLRCLKDYLTALFWGSTLQSYNMYMMILIECLNIGYPEIHHLIFICAGIPWYPTCFWLVS